MILAETSVVVGYLRTPTLRVQQIIHFSLIQSVLPRLRLFQEPP